MPDDTKPVTETTKKAGRPPAIKPKPVEKVNTGNEEKPLVDAKTEDVEKVGSGKKCPNHPEARAVLYGLCSTCYAKLPKSEKRRLYLTARIYGSNAHNYPREMMRTWKRELVLIGAGLWKRPLKTKTKTKLAEEIMG